MRVEMTTHITGYRDGLEWPLAGGVVDVPDHEAADLIASGYAKEATDAEAGPDDGADPADAEAEAEAEADVDPAGDAGDDAAPVKRTRRK